MPRMSAAMWLIVLPLMFKLSPPIVSPRDHGSQSLDWGPVPHFCPLEALQPVWLMPEAYCTVLFTTSSWSFCCDKSAVVAGPCIVLKKHMFFLSILSHECGRNKGRHWQSSLCYILWDVARFPRGSVKTHHPCAIHPFSTDEGKPHMTPWDWGVVPRSPTYSETDLPQGQVPGYPPPADVPGSHSSLGSASS
jgi:hypothetical protein